MIALRQPECYRFHRAGCKPAGEYPQHAPDISVYLDAAKVDRDATLARWKKANAAH
jgi:hypothetical protein